MDKIEKALAALKRVEKSSLSSNPQDWSDALDDVHEAIETLESQSVSGRIISEELYKTICEELTHCKHGLSDFLDEFRNAPVVGQVSREVIERAGNKAWSESPAWNNDDLNDGILRSLSAVYDAIYALRLSSPLTDQVISHILEPFEKLVEFVQARRGDLPEPWMRKDAGPVLYDAEEALKLLTAQKPQAPAVEVLTRQALQGLRVHTFEVPRFEDSEFETVEREFYSVPEVHALLTSRQGAHS